MRFSANSKSAREAGLFPRGKNGDIGVIYDYLSEKGVPVGKVEEEVRYGAQRGQIQRYRFTTTVFEEEARNLLEIAQGLVFEAMRKPTVLSVGPVAEKMPTTADLERNSRGQYNRVFKLLASKGITNNGHMRKMGVTLSGMIGENPPVTVFVCDERFYVAKRDSIELEAFLVQALGLPRSIFRMNRVDSDHL